MSIFDKAKIGAEIAKILAEIVKLGADTWAVGRDQRIRDLESEVSRLKERLK